MDVFQANYTLLILFIINMFEYSWMVSSIAILFIKYSYVI